MNSTPEAAPRVVESLSCASERGVRAPVEAGNSFRGGARQSPASGLGGNTYRARGAYLPIRWSPIDSAMLALLAWICLRGLF